MSVSSRFLNSILSKKRGEPEETAWTERIKQESGARPSFANHPALAEIRLLTAAAKKLGVGDPFFRMHEGRGGARTVIGGKEYLNFSHYNYLGLNGDPRVMEAAKAAIGRYGTSAGASRLVAGERPAQRELEKALAEVYDAEDCVVFVSGHATNVSAISTLFGPKDIIFHDSLIHNSVIEGIRASGAIRKPFAHNDMKELERALEERRGGREKALIVVEGHYSMDGDIANLPALLELRDRYEAFLMVDEAHSLGVLGKTGRGLAEHYGVDGSEVDIWMGTLSKTLVSCGGYIAGSADLIELLKAQAPGFVYSVGISPPLAAASLAALKIMREEPERVARLNENARLFLELTRAAGLNAGSSCGKAIIPVIIGSSRKSIELSNRLFEAGINAQPIIHPAVEEKVSRLRFFVNSDHTEADIRACCEITGKFRKR
ncbi:MAG: aminotransferase class I/II-fold pyridoxal phosphate-dependent enzyme [Desulfovibrio sp.]|nr:aminotransferase class I/II-fold pyridoxal phosphate-dependent enzyme [Desulfovibrio sp.]